MELAGRPTGIVALLFTDIEGSTKQWEVHGPVMGAAVHQHDRLLREAIESRGGYVFKTVGDAFCAAFSSVHLAIETAVAIQHALHEATWGEVGVVRVREAIHAGQTEERGGDYFGPAVNRVARLLSAGHGGQILLSAAAEQIAQSKLTGNWQFRTLGEHRLKDLTRPERIFQLVAPGLESDFPPISTLDHRPNNLPVQSTPFLGRDNDLELVRDLLDKDEVRLVTLTGPGGAGKTRIAIQAGAEALERFPDGVWLVELEEATSEHRAIEAIVRVLAVRETANQRPLDSLIDHLANRTALLILDNLEQVLEVGPAVARLLTSAPGIKVIATSRMRLGVQMEREFRVPPMGVPPRDSRGLTAASIRAYPAIRLFVERAQAVKHDFVLTDANAEAVTAICRELDGLPLAIELAAARVRLLSPQALLQRLNDRLGLLTGGGIDRPGRQQTLRAAIQWSHDLLDDEERLLLARLSIFSGGWTLEAAESIGSHDSSVNVLEVLEHLVDHSLVRAEETPDADIRYAMLASVRAFAREQLMAIGGGEGELTAMLHAESVLSFVEAAEPACSGPDQAVWLARVDREFENIRTALAWCETTREGEMALRLVVALRRFFWVRGYYTEGRAFIAAALEADRWSTDALCARALDMSGMLAWGQADFEDARTDLEAARDLYQALSDRAGQARVLNQLGAVSSELGDQRAAADHFQQSLAIRKGLGDTRGAAIMMINLAEIAIRQLDFQGAITLATEAHAAVRALDDHQLTAIALINLAGAQEFAGDSARAASTYQRALTIARELGDRHHTGVVLIGLARLEASGDTNGIALQCASEALDLAIETGQDGLAADAFEAAGIVLTEGGNSVPAVAAFAAADALRETTRSPGSPATIPLRAKRMMTLRDRLTPAEFAAAWDEGKFRPIEESAREVRSIAGQLSGDVLASASR